MENLIEKVVPHCLKYQKTWNILIEIIDDIVPPENGGKRSVCNFLSCLIWYYFYIKYYSLNTYGFLFYFRDKLELSTEEVHNPGLDAAISLINGRFIVDGQHFLREIRSLEFHRTTCLQSSNGYFRLLSTSTKSLVWRLDFQCPYCKLKRTIFSEPRYQSVANEETTGENVNSSLKIVDPAQCGGLCQ
jgi:hypothetical protein